MTPSLDTTLLEVKWFLHLRPRPQFSILPQCNRDLEVWSVLFRNFLCGRFAAVWAEPTCRRLSSAHQTLLRYDSRAITDVFLSKLCSTRRADIRTSSHLQQCNSWSIRARGQLARRGAVLSEPKCRGEQHPARLRYAVCHLYRAFSYITHF